MKTKRELITQRDPKSPVSEVFRTLRTNIQFMNANKKLKTLLITSTFPSEGKSWVASNLAVTFAQTGKRVISVGTTSCRVLETIADEKTGMVAPTEGDTQIFIYPGYKFKCIDGLITNFHLPQSTLLMLVSALAGKEYIMKAYNEAVENRYRFFSFGDAMFIK